MTQFPRSASSAGTLLEPPTPFSVIDHEVIRMLVHDPADAKSALKYSESIFFQVIRVRILSAIPMADFVLFQFFVLALQASSLPLP